MKILLSSNQFYKFLRVSAVVCFFAATVCIILGVFVDLWPYLLFSGIFFAIVFFIPLTMVLWENAKIITGFLFRDNNE